MARELSSTAYEDFNSMTKDELQLAVSVLAKTANQRLRALEKADLTRASNAYRYVERQADDNEFGYGDPIYGKTKKGEWKFRTDVTKMDMGLLKHEVAELRDFLFEAKTSTVKGVKQRYQQAYDTWKEKNPDSQMSFNDFSEMWHDVNTKKLIKMFGSDVAIEMIEKESKNHQLTADEINEVIEQIKENESFLSVTRAFENKQASKKLSTSHLDTSVL